MSGIRTRCRETGTYTYQGLQTATTEAMAAASMVIATYKAGLENLAPLVLSVEWPCRVSLFNIGWESL